MDATPLQPLVLRICASHPSNRLTLVNVRPAANEKSPMTDLTSDKSMTRKVVISHPDEELLEMKLEGRKLAPELSKFLKNLVRTKKWTKNITIPSTHDNVAVALLFTSTLKESGLEILTEIHVYYCGRIFVEVWEMLPETTRANSLPPRAFSSLEVGKIRVIGSVVHVEVKVALDNRTDRRILKIYDFSTDEPTVETRQEQNGDASA